MVGNDSKNFGGTHWPGQGYCELLPLADEEMRNAKQRPGVRGTPWEPVLGNGDRRVPVAIDGQGFGAQAAEDDGVDEELPVGDEEGEAEASF